MKNILVFDIETHGAENQWNYTPEAMFRLGGYSWHEDQVTLTDDLEEMRAVIRKADLVIGHNIHAFDLPVIFGKDSIEPLEMSLAEKVWDTWTHAAHVFPAPFKFKNRHGKTFMSDTPEKMKRWFALDNLCYQLGLPGKVEDLKALAKEFGGYGEIPLDDPRFREYLVGDVNASRAVGRALLKLTRNKFTEYDKREQINAAIDAQNSRNGWRVHQKRAQARVDELDAERDGYMQMLVDKFDMPSEGKAPLRTNAGKAAIVKALESVGIIAERDLPKTDKGKPSFGGEGLIGAAEGRGEEAEQLAKAIARIGGMRPLAEGALKNLHDDGKVHVEIQNLQRSGRKSTTRPGLTIWTSRGEGAVEKSYFIPNADDELLVEFDYSQADARIVAALSGDVKFKERFAPGADAHLITAWAVWGKETVGTDRSDPKTEAYRNTAKALGHAYAYRAGAKRLAAASGQPLAVAEQFVSSMQAEYEAVTRWQNRAEAEAKKTGAVTNFWGRRMIVDKGREYTQAPALLGQSGTREIVVDALIRLARRDLSIICMLVAQVHDALVFSIPIRRLREVTAIITDEMTTLWGPPNGSGQKILFPVEHGEPSLDWQAAGH